MSRAETEREGKGGRKTNTGGYRFYYSFPFFSFHLFRGKPIVYLILLCIFPRNQKLKDEFFFSNNSISFLGTVMYSKSTISTLK